MQTVRGMKDLLFEEQVKHRWIINTCINISERFGFKEIATPLLEFSKIFEKVLSDIDIEKETYHFVDKGGNSLTLRPEGTAGVVRAVIHHKLYQNHPLKFIYSGPMFRYERPQKGRLRQFHQLGLEIFGENSPLAEIELIEIAQMIFKELKMLDKVQLIINSIGDRESQKRYKEKLVDYLTPYKNDLSLDSQKRLLKNPLRILDSKNKQDQELLQSAPRIEFSLNKKSKDFYNKLISLLEEKNIFFTKKDFLVRGLDYYCHSVFEYVSADLGAQSAVMAGGRYDGLVQSMGGPSLSAVGWAGGLERISLLCSLPASQVPLLAIVGFDESFLSEVSQLATQLRSAGYHLYIPTAGTLSKQIKKAHKQKCSFVFIIHSNEWKNGDIILRNMKTGKQKNIPKTDIANWKEWID